MSRDIDWSKAGVRLRHSPKVHGKNVDFNWPEQRWKVAEEYAADTLTTEQIVAKVACPRANCLQAEGEPCRDSRGNPMEGAHTERRFAAGTALIADGWAMGGAE